MRSLRYLEDRTGLALGRLCCPRRASAGIVILLTGLAFQVANFT